MIAGRNLDRDGELEKYMVKLGHKSYKCSACLDRRLASMHCQLFVLISGSSFQSQLFVLILFSCLLISQSVVRLGKDL